MAAVLTTHLVAELALELRVAVSAIDERELHELTPLQIIATFALPEREKAQSIEHNREKPQLISNRLVNVMRIQYVVKLSESATPRQ